MRARTADFQSLQVTQQRRHPTRHGPQVIVSCQKGLRSLAAAEQMSRAGYQNLAWINGGLDTAGKDTLPTTNGVDLRYGGVGGVSQVPPGAMLQMHATMLCHPSCSSSKTSCLCLRRLGILLSGPSLCMHGYVAVADVIR